MTFDCRQSGISKIAWLDNISGDFLVSSPKSGTLKLFNAAIQQPKEVIKVSRHTIASVVATKQ